MLKADDEVWVVGYIQEGGQKINLSTSGVVLENQIPRKNTILVRLDKYNGEKNIDKRVLAKFVNLL